MSSLARACHSGLIELTLTEGGLAITLAYEVRSEELSAQLTVVVRGEMPAEQMPVWLPEAYATVFEYPGRAHVRPVAPPFARFTFLGDTVTGLTPSAGADHDHAGAVGGVDECPSEPSTPRGASGYRRSVGDLAADRKLRRGLGGDGDRRPASVLRCGGVRRPGPRTRRPCLGRRGCPAPAGRRTHSRGRRVQRDDRVVVRRHVRVTPATLQRDADGRLYKDNFGMASARAVSLRTAEESAFERARKALFEEGSQPPRCTSVRSDRAPRTSSTSLARLRSAAAAPTATGTKAATALRPASVE